MVKLVEKNVPMAFQISRFWREMECLQYLIWIIHKKLVTDVFFFKSLYYSEQTLVHASFHCPYRVTCIFAALELLITKSSKS